MSGRLLAAGVASALGFSSFLLAGCGNAPAAGPPEILYGADVCDHCRMVISERRHAAAARLVGRELRFDDPGCLLESLDSRAPGAAAVAWVHDEHETWLPMEDAWFVQDPAGGTPMASGLWAFGSWESATAAGERYGSSPRRRAELDDGDGSMDEP